MKRNRILKVIAAIFVIATGFLLSGEFIGKESYNRNFFDKIDSIFGSKYEVTEKSPYYEIDKNPPQFSSDDLKMRPDFELYSDLDKLNRVGPANALIGPDSLPKVPRGDISKVYPTGWHQKFYDFVEGGAVYNRCHLIAYQLTGENDNWKNLMTGTRSFNAKGMLPFENAVGNYIRDTGKKVRYRVTPIFVGDELVARGVIIEAYSIEDHGKKINFRVFVKNIEKGVWIDYKTGRTRLYKN